MSSLGTGYEDPASQPEIIHAEGVILDAGSRMGSKSAGYKRVRLGRCPFYLFCLFCLF
jgi:hypothetical protein